MWEAYVGIVIVDAAGLPTETRLDEIKKLQQICAAGDLWRRCAIFRALDQLEPGATGRPAGAWLEPAPGEEWQFDAPTSTMSKLAREALIRIGGQDLAEALGSGVCEQNLLAAQHIAKHGPGIQAFDHLVTVAMKEFDEPKVLNYAAWIEFELALPSWAAHQWRPATFLRASELYKAAATAARKQAGGFLPSPLLWEAVNALGLAGGPDGLGTPIGTLREASQEASDLDERMVRGVYENLRKGPSQAETAVRTVLEARATRMPADKVSRTDYHSLTLDELRASAKRKVKMVNRPAGKQAAMLSGPMCIPGRPPPPEPAQGTYKEEFM